MIQQHFCSEHNCPFYRNEKNGKVWYSHKIKETGEYHNEPKVNDEEFVEKKYPNETVFQDERSYRIERQHSQEMAIRALELFFKCDPDKVSGQIADKGLETVIKIMTDRFAADLEKE